MNLTFSKDLNFLKTKKNNPVIPLGSVCSSRIILCLKRERKRAGKTLLEIIRDGFCLFKNLRILREYSKKKKNISIMFFFKKFLNLKKTF